MSASLLNLENLNPASINNLLANSSVHVNWTGSRTVSGQFGSMQLDSIIERLKVISNQPRLLSDDDRQNGHECVIKIRTFYRQTDGHLFAIIRNVFDAIIRLFELPLFLFGIYPRYSPRECIDIKAGDVRTIGPTNISSNFKYRIR